MANPSIKPLAAGTWGMTDGTMWLGNIFADEVGRITSVQFDKLLLGSKKYWVVHTPGVSTVTAVKPKRFYDARMEDYCGER